MADFAQNPFGIVDAKIKIGAVTTDLPLIQKITATPVIETAELTGDDIVAAAFSLNSQWNIQLQFGGLSLDAIAALLGITITGTTTLTAAFIAGNELPSFKFGGKLKGQGTQDKNVIFWLCKVVGINTDSSSKQFSTFTLDIVAIPDPANAGKVFDIVAYETSVALAL